MRRNVVRRRVGTNREMVEMAILKEIEKVVQALEMDVLWGMGCRILRV